MSGFRVQYTHPSVNPNPAPEAKTDTNMTTLFGNYRTPAFATVNTPAPTSNKPTTSHPNAGTSQGLAIRNMDVSADHY